MRVSRWSVVAACAAATVGLAGCGGNGATQTATQDSDKQQQTTDQGGGGGSPVAAVQAAYSATTAVKTAKVHFSQTVDMGSRKMSMKGNGVINFTAPAVQMTMSMSGMSGLMQGKKTAVRMVDGVYYVKLPKIPGMGKMPGNFEMPEWIKLDPGSLAKKTGQKMPSSMRTENMKSPAAMLALLRGASEKVTKVGTEQVRGVPTTHYKLTVNVKQLANKRGMGHRMASKMAKMVGRTMPVHVWLDDRNRVRRQMLDLSISKDGKTAKMHMVMELYDFGTPVQVKAPKGAMTFSRMMKKMTQSIKNMREDLMNGGPQAGLPQ